MTPKQRAFHIGSKMFDIDFETIESRINSIFNEDDIAAVDLDVVKRAYLRRASDYSECEATEP